MRSLHTHLKDGDPVAHEIPPSSEEMQRVRRAVLAAAGAPRPRLTLGRRRAWAVAGALAVVAGAAGVGRWSNPLSESQPIPSGASVDSPSRQLQFATPGGTRVIWVFNSDFQP